MSRPPGFYAALEEAQKQIQDDLDKGIDRKAEQEPTIEQTPSPGVYAPLEEAHRQVQADLDKGIDRTAEQEPAIDQSPERPEGHPAEGLGWTDRGDMVSQQRAAMDWVKRNDAARPQGEREADRSDEDLVRFPGLTRDDDHEDREQDIDQGIGHSPGGDGRGS